MTSSDIGNDLRNFFTLPLDLFRREHLENIHFHLSISNIVPCFMGFQGSDATMF